MYNDFSTVMPLNYSYLIDRFFYSPYPTCTQGMIVKYSLLNQPTGGPMELSCTRYSPLVSPVMLNSK